MYVIYIDLGENANNSQDLPGAWYSRCIILLYIYIICIDLGVIPGVYPGPGIPHVGVNTNYILSYPTAR